VDRWSGDVQLKRPVGFEDSNFTFSVKISDSANPPHDVTEVITVQVSNFKNFFSSSLMLHQESQIVCLGNTKGESITVLLTSCLIGLD
jgi:hypothetical protein